MGMIVVVGSSLVACVRVVMTNERDTYRQCQPPRSNCPPVAEHEINLHPLSVRSVPIFSRHPFREYDYNFVHLYQYILVCSAESLGADLTGRRPFNPCPTAFRLSGTNDLPIGCGSHESFLTNGASGLDARGRSPRPHQPPWCR